MLNRSELVRSRLLATVCVFFVWGELENAILKLVDVMRSVSDL